MISAPKSLMRSRGSECGCTALDGLKKSEASELFNISRNTIDLWLNRLKETGDFAAKPNQPPGNNHKIRDWSKFEEFARTLWR